MLKIYLEHKPKHYLHFFPIYSYSLFDYYKNPIIYFDIPLQVFEDDVSITSDGEPPMFDENEQLSPVVEEKSLDFSSDADHKGGELLPLQLIFTLVFLRSTLNFRVDYLNLKIVTAILEIFLECTTKLENGNENHVISDNLPAKDSESGRISVRTF